MRFLFFSAALGFTTLLFSPLSLSGTAWQALDSLKAQRGAETIRSVTQIRGHRGQDQPQVWEVATRIADGERVFVLEGEKIVEDTMFSTGGGVPVDMRRLRVDSGEVFMVANRLATESKVGFDALDYELTAAAHGNAPLWIVHLRDVNGSDVGRLEISGEDARVLKKEWFSPRAPNRPGIEGDSSVVVDSSSPPAEKKPYEIPPQVERPAKAVWQRTTSGVEGAGERVKEGFRSIGEGFGKIFRGEATYTARSESRHKMPRTSPSRRR